MHIEIVVLNPNVGVLMEVNREPCSKEKQRVKGENPRFGHKGRQKIKALATSGIGRKCPEN